MRVGKCTNGNPFYIELEYSNIHITKVGVNLIQPTLIQKSFLECPLYGRPCKGLRGIYKLFFSSLLSKNCWVFHGRWTVWYKAKSESQEALEDLTLSWSQCNFHGLKKTANSRHSSHQKVVSIFLSLYIWPCHILWTINAAEFIHGSCRSRL